MTEPKSRKLVVDLAATSANWRLPEWGERAISEAAPKGWDVRFVHAPTVSDGDGGARPSDEVLSAIGDAEAYVGFGMSPALFEAATTLKWLHSAAAGVGSLRFPAMLERQPLITNSAGVHAVPIAEHVLGGLIHFFRSFDIAGAQQREGRWNKEPFVGRDDTVREIGECRVLIVGTGGIGRELAQRLQGLGAECIGVRRRPELGAPPGFARVVGLSEIDAQLGDVDAVVLSAPHTGETDRMFDAARLDRLSPRAILVNVARGTLLDEAALAERLADGRLRGAVLDVFAHEPLAGDSPLWQLPNVLLTPHVSAVSPRRFWHRALALLLDNWRRYDAGEPLRNRVDLHAGY